MIPNPRLIKFRKEQGLIQDEIALLLEVSTSFYQKIENGERNPSFNFITKFKKLFPETNTDYIFFNQKNHEACREIKSKTGTDCN